MLGRLVVLWMVTGTVIVYRGPSILPEPTEPGTSSGIGIGIGA